MKTATLRKILEKVYSHELNVDDAWKIIDADREAPNEYSKNYWLPLEGD